MFVYKHTETIENFNKKLFLRKMQTLRVNNSRIVWIKNAKFLEYYFFMNTNIEENFQICISVPLKKSFSCQPDKNKVGKPPTGWNIVLLLTNLVIGGKYQSSFCPKNVYGGYQLSMVVTSFDVVYCTQPQGFHTFCNPMKPT